MLDSGSADIALFPYWRGSCTSSGLCCDDSETETEF